jgi:DNA replication protein DnaC
MLLHPLLDQLRELRCVGMAQALEEQLQHHDLPLTFEERLSQLVERECYLRDNRRLTQRLRSAMLKQSSACVEDIDYRASRGLVRSVVNTLSECQWVRDKHNILLIGPTGTGKSYLACALSHKACLMGFNVRYVRLPQLLQELQIAKGDGRYLKLMQQLAKVHVLILDDWGLAPLSDTQRRDLLEILDDRYQRTSTIVTSQLPLKHWHESIGDATLADAILDRLVHNAHKIELKGGSLRKKNTVDVPENNVEEESEEKKS